MALSPKEVLKLTALTMKDVRRVEKEIDAFLADTIGAPTPSPITPPSGASLAVMEVLASRYRDAGWDVCVVDSPLGWGHKGLELSAPSWN